MGVEIFLLLLSIEGLHWTDYGRCKFPEYGFECEIDPGFLELLDKVLEYE